MVTVAVSSDVHRVREMVTEEGLKYPVYMAAGKVNRQFKVGTLPTTYVLNADGMIVGSSVGYSPKWDLNRLLSYAMED